MSDAPIEITRLVKSDGPLTKRIHLDPQGALANDSRDCRMSQGTMSRLPVPDLRTFASLRKHAAQYRVCPRHNAARPAGFP